jgi:uncharacterized protein
VTDAAEPTEVDDSAEAVVGADETTAVPAEEIVYKVMSIESVLFDLGETSPQVHLMEADLPYRYLSIPIALAEAQALHNAMNGIVGRRPGTHELLAEMLTRLRADVISARIVRFDAGVFYAELDLMTPRGREVFDCRTSDALIISQRQRVPAPVLCNEEILSSE